MKVVRTVKMEHKIRRVEYNCIAGSQFDYFCDHCSLHLRGYLNQNDEPSVCGWTWELTRDNSGEEVASAGNKFVRSYGGTEESAYEEGMKRFRAEPCHKLN